MNPCVDSCLGTSSLPMSCSESFVFVFRSGVPDKASGTRIFLLNKKCKATQEYMGVSKNRGTPKSPILTGFSMTNHPFWVPLFSETPIWNMKDSGRKA